MLSFLTARLSHIRLGDANSKIFHLRANGRRRKNFIVNLRHSQGLAITHEEKQEVLRSHFERCLGTAEPRTATLNWEELGYHARDLTALEAPFPLEELKRAVFDSPREKTPGMQASLHGLVEGPAVREAGAHYSSCFRPSAGRSAFSHAIHPCD